MSYSMNQGILSIQDPKGRYVGMQNIARTYLNRQNIDISTLGPKEEPDSVVISISEKRKSPIPKTEQHTMRMKADYIKNATPELFETLLSKATNRFNFDSITNKGDTFNVYYNNSLTDTVTKEQFYNEKPDYTFVKTV